MIISTEIKSSLVFWSIWGQLRFHNYVIAPIKPTNVATCNSASTLLASEFHNLQVCVKVLLFSLNSPTCPNPKDAILNRMYTIVSNYFKLFL